MSSLAQKIAARYVEAKKSQPVVEKKDPNKMRGEAPARRNPVVQGLIERGTSGAGKHKNKQDYDRGHARNPKHPLQREDRQASEKTAEPYDCWKDGLRGRELAECYMRFEDDLGLKDIALIQQYFPGWSPSGGGGYSSRKPTVAVPDIGKRIRRLLLVTSPTSDVQSKKFLRDQQHATSLTTAQLKWVESLEKKYARKLADMPEDPHLVVTHLGVFLVEGKLNSSERAKIERHFDLVSDPGDPTLYYPGGLAILPKTEKVPAPVVRAPSPVSDRNQFEGDQLQNMVRILGVLAQRTGQGMFLGFKKDLETGKGLTEDQLKAVRAALYRSGMKPDAEIFRMASAERVAMLYRSLLKV